MWVVISYWIGETGESKAWTFDTEEKARSAMERLWNKSRDFAKEDENYDEKRTYHEPYEARVAWDDELYRCFDVIKVSEREEI